MNKAEMLKLADDVAGAAGADRELDCEIALAVGWHPPGIDPRLFRDSETGPVYARRTPAYTASLDAAMTLVPEGCVWNLQMNGDGTAGADCAEFIQTADYPETQAATPALALTSACLRALAEEEGV